MKENVKIGIKEYGVDAYQVWFKIGNQTFGIAPSKFEPTAEDNLRVAEFYRKNLETAFKNLGADTDVMTSERLEEIKKAVEWWQENDMLHSLTCGNDSSHRPLVPKIYKSQMEVWLDCEDCGYCQTWIPDMVVYTEQPEQ